MANRKGIPPAEPRAVDVVEAEIAELTGRRDKLTEMIPDVRQQVRDLTDELKHLEKSRTKANNKLDRLRRELEAAQLLLPAGSADTSEDTDEVEGDRDPSDPKGTIADTLQATAEAGEELPNIEMSPTIELPSVTELSYLSADTIGFYSRSLEIHTVAALAASIEDGSLNDRLDRAREAGIPLPMNAQMIGDAKEAIRRFKTEVGAGE